MGNWKTDVEEKGNTKKEMDIGKKHVEESGNRKGDWKRHAQDNGNRPQPAGLVKVKKEKWEQEMEIDCRGNRKREEASFFAGVKRKIKTVHIEET